MLESGRVRELFPTSLTWEEQNPFSYRFNNRVITRLEKVTEQVRRDNGMPSKEKHHAKKDK